MQRGKLILFKSPPIAIATPTIASKNPTDSNSNPNSMQKKQRQQSSGSTGDETHASHISHPDSHPESREESSFSTRGSSGNRITDLFTRLAQLDGHKRTVTGITLPSGSDKLYTASEDGDDRIWDCHTGRCDDQQPFIE